MIAACFLVASWYNYSLPNYPDYGSYNLTAASRDYPRGTNLEVCNIANDKCVTVRVNDYIEDRTRNIDLSKAAFSAIGDLKTGLLHVTIIKI